MNAVASKDQPNATEDIDGDGSPSRAGGDQGAPAWWHPAATVAKVSSVPKAVEKKLARQPLARMTLAWPRTVRYLVGEVLGEDVPGVPPARLTPSLVGHVVMDESIMALAVGPNRFPRRADYVRVGDELARAHDLFTERGWLDDPISFHQTPPPMEEPVRTKGWALGQSYERIWWPNAMSVLFASNLPLKASSRRCFSLRSIQRTIDCRSRSICASPVKTAWAFSCSRVRS